MFKTFSFINFKKWFGKLHICNPLYVFRCIEHNTVSLKMAYSYHKHWEQHTHILQILLRLKILALSCNALNTSLKSTEFHRIDLFFKFEEIDPYGLFYDAAIIWDCKISRQIILKEAAVA